MKFHYRLFVFLTAAALAATAGCGTSVEGAATAGDEITTSSPVSTTEAAPPEETPVEELPAEVPPAEEASAEEPPISAAATDVDPATLAWVDATCLDMVTMAESFMAFPEVASDASPEEHAIANIDYYDALATAVNGLLADVHSRQAPGIPSGDLVHDAYAEHMNALGTAAAEGAMDIELMHRSGSPEDLTDTINRVQTSVDELASADFAAGFVDDVELGLMMEAAMDAAPSCAALS